MDVSSGSVDGCDNGAGFRCLEVAKWTETGLSCQSWWMSIPPVSVSLLALGETTASTLYGLHEVFSAVGVAWAELTGEAGATRRMEPRIVAAGTQTFTTDIGIPIAPQASIDEVARCDVVIVTDLALPTDTDPRGKWPRETAWLRGQFERNALVCSVCTGAVFLAEAGILDGCEATTHWSAAGLLKTCYPAVRVRPERILCPAGPEHRIVTCGGASSWEDLALHLVARFCGAAEAVRIAKIFVIGDRSDGQLPFSAMGTRSHEDAVIGKCQQWIAEHYGGPHPVSRMVARSGLAERTFKRRFKLATGYAPVDYVQALRMEEAKQILETSDAPTDAVAHMVGYEDPAFFRRLFKRLTGITPARYRQRFRFIATRGTGWGGLDERQQNPADRRQAARGARTRAPAAG
jgi:transcriptional regulator GlxA family with amidase domain